MISKLINEMDRLTLAMTEATTLAREAGTTNEAIGAMVDLPTMIADLEAMFRVVVALHRRER